MAAWRITARRSDRKAVAQQCALAAATAAEARDWARERAEEVPLAVDPPPTRLYVEPGWVMFRGGLVHETCLKAWLRGGQLSDGCAVHLTDDVTSGRI
jgi:hypothetical protein